MGQRVRLAFIVGLVCALPLACGPSSSSDDDDDDHGDAGDGAHGGKGGGAGAISAASGNAGRGGNDAGGGSTGGSATPGSGGTSTAGNGATGGTLTLPEGGRNFFTGGTGANAGTTTGAGKGGTSGRGATSGRGGSAGAPTSVSALGASCIQDTDCEDPTLICLASSDLSDGSGPPGGICTKACTSSSDCTRYGAAFCYAFTNGDQYCIEGCTTGSAGAPKCHSRQDFACSLIGVLPGSASCADNDDCHSGELCDPSAGTCGAIVTGCVPLCAGDFHCKSGQFCDFASGVCVSERPTGLPLGAECTPPAGNAADACQGFCDAGSDPGQGTCSSLCTLQTSAIGCGWDGSGTPDQVCLFGTILSPPGDATPGDIGLCGTLCDCNIDCLRAGDYCVDETGGQIAASFRRKGYCRPLDVSETSSDSFAKCSSGAGGEGGAGGAN